MTLTGDVAAVHIDTRALQEALGVVRRNVELQRETFELTSLRFETGFATARDVQESSTLLTKTRSIAPGLEAELQQSKNALAVLLDRPPSSMSVLVGGSGRIPTARARVDVGVPAEHLRRRPGIRAAELEAAAQSARIGVAINDLYPQFVLTGVIGVRAPDAGSLFQSGSLTGLASSGIAWNVLNYGCIKNNVRAQDAAFQCLIANYRSIVLNAYAEVENAMVACENGRQQVARFSRSVDASRRAAEIGLEQYRDGVSDYTRVLNTRQSRLEAEANLIDARALVSKALVGNGKRLGGGWQVRRDEEFLPDEVLNEMAWRTDWGDLLGRDPERMSIANRRQRHSHNADNDREAGAGRDCALDEALSALACQKATRLPDGSVSLISRSPQF